MKTYSKILSLSCALLFMALVSACTKHVPVPPPPAPVSGSGAAPAGSNSGMRATIAEFVAEPSTIERGQSANLRWNVTGASEVSIDHGLGTVASTGTQRLTPPETITYTLTASGPGGNATRSATITVTGPAPPPPTTNNTGNGRRGTLESRIQADLQDVLFDYDSNNIRDDSRNALAADADALKRIFTDFPTATVNVEGHCDERGSAEYNLGLGDRRATAARDFLVQLGVPADRLKTISYGKERPVCTESDDSCWQRNRRAHFSTGQ